MTYIVPGVPRIRILNSDLTTSQIDYILPPPDKGYPKITWDPVQDIKKDIYGNEHTRRLGWIPQVKLKWSLYNDVQHLGYPMGTANNNMIDFPTLLAVLDHAPGHLAFSPGPSAGGFVVQSYTMSDITLRGAGLVCDVELTLRGGYIHTSKTLAAY